MVEKKTVFGLSFCNFYCSAGTEVRARQQMCAHLTEHLEEIKKNVGEEADHCIVETIEMEHEVQHQENQEAHMVEQMEVVEEIVETGEDSVQVIHEGNGEQILDAVYEVEEQTPTNECHESHEQQQMLEEATYEITVNRKRRHSASSATMRYSSSVSFLGPF